MPQLPDDQGWRAAVIIMLMNLQNPRAGSSATATQPPAAPQMAVRGTKDFSPGLKIFLRNNIRLILLREDLECYSRRIAQKVHSAKTPFALVKVCIY